MRQPNNKKGPEGMAKVNKDVVKRLMSYIGHYKLRFAAVLICIVVNALAMVSCSLYLQTLIDSYITPLLQAATPDFAPLFRSILIMGCIYAVGILACLFYNRTMVSIAQGTLKRIRDEMFEHMQTLPIRYFDTHTHGDIMSHYTNDTDTLRQMLAQSIPQMFSSLITIISVFFAMLFTSWQLTIFVLCFVFIMLQVTGRVAGKSGYYFIRQQKALGDVNGYIEEMINGQKVVKVFCHEEQAKAGFDVKNGELCANATKANSYAYLDADHGESRKPAVCASGNHWRHHGTRRRGRYDDRNDRIFPAAQPKLYESDQSDFKSAEYGCHGTCRSRTYF